MAAAIRSAPWLLMLLRLLQAWLHPNETLPRRTRKWQPVWKHLHCESKALKDQGTNARPEKASSTKAPMLDRSSNRDPLPSPFSEPRSSLKHFQGRCDSAPRLLQTLAASGYPNPSDCEGMHRNCEPHHEVFTHKERLYKILRNNGGRLWLSVTIGEWTHPFGEAGFSGPQVAAVSANNSSALGR